jgi:transposase-like protein
MGAELGKHWDTRSMRAWAGAAVIAAMTRAGNGAGDFGAVEMEVRRDRQGSFEPKYCRNMTGALKASMTRFCRCMRVEMSTREIQAHLEEIYESRGERIADQRSDGCGDGRGTNLAEPAA